MRLLRVYPPAWRARYGEELVAVIEALDGGARMSWRTRADVVRAGLAERARAFGLAGLPPRERAREGSIRVLYAWMVFAIGGFGIGKASEHWVAATPVAARGGPTAAFALLVAGAALGSAAVLAGVALALPRLAALILAGGWARVRRPILRAVLLSLLVLAATAALAVWAHSLSPAQRNGGDGTYGAVFLAWVALSAACLVSWAAAAAGAARALALPPRLLRAEAWLAAAVSAAMAMVTLATAIWWALLARDAPWFFTGAPAGSSAPAFTGNMLVPTAVMACATIVAIAGAVRALEALPSLPAGPQA
jgi:hypothetical protein